MVSGTPLYDGIDDLNGELNFLQIWPFALRDAEDGFWQLKVGNPWEHQDPLVLDKLALLLGGKHTSSPHHNLISSEIFDGLLVFPGVMMRHSKTQTNVRDGLSILRLPPITTRLCAINPSESEAATTAFIEVLSVKLLRHTNVIDEVIAERAAADAEDAEDDDDTAAFATAGRRRPAAERGRRRRGGGVIDQLLKLQRQAATAAALVAGGSGCRDQLKDIDNLLRRIVALGQGAAPPAAAAATAAGAAGGGAAGGANGGVEMQKKPINKAYEDLMQGQQRQQLRQNADFEWTSNSTVNMYHTGGWRQAMTAVERRDEAVTRQAELSHRLAGERRFAGRQRWRWAVEQLSSGKGLTLPMVVLPQSDGGDGDGSGGTSASGLPARPWGYNVVHAYFDTLPLSQLRKVFQHEKMAQASRAAASAVAAASASAAAMTAGDLATALQLPASDEQAMENRVNRKHWEKQYSQPQRTAISTLRTAHLKESPIGWRRPEQTPLTGAYFTQLPIAKTIRGEGRGPDLFKQNPTGARQAWESATGVAEDLQNLLPWVAVCEAAAEAEEAAGGAAAVAGDQSGFQDIQNLMENANPNPVRNNGSSAAAAAGGGFVPNCPVCLEPLVVGDGPKQPVVTRCIHLFCSVCIEAHMRSFHIVNVNVAADAECQCPICRRAIRMNELVLLRPRDDGDSNTGATGDGQAIDDDDAAAAAAAPVAAAAGDGGPSLSLAAAEDTTFTSIPLPRGPMLPLMPQFPAVPARLLTHLSEAAGVLPASAASVAPRPSGRSSKMMRLLEDLDQALHNGSEPGKAVVFSQHKSVIQHASTLLKAAAVRHVSIAPGDSQTTLREAVATFNAEKSCGVFLLHAGTAAAGLTLTAARHVFLLEPFLAAAEEAQAMNRAHRIGQRHPVTVTTYYVRNTIEERLLAYRQLGGEAEAQAPPTPGKEAAGVAAELGLTQRAGPNPAAVGVTTGAGMGGSDAQGLTAAKLR